MSLPPLLLLLKHYATLPRKPASDYRSALSTQIRDDDIQETGDSGSNHWAATENSVRKQQQRAGAVTRFSAGGMATSGSFNRTAAGDAMIVFDEVRAMTWRLLNPRS